MDLKIPNLSKIDFDSIRMPIVEMNKINEEMEKSMREATEEREKRYKDGVYREEKMIELLQSIDKNTAVLSDMLVLLEENTKDQKLILEIINDFNSLATINDKKETKSLYRKIMNKISTVTTDIKTINTLCGYGMTIYNMLQTMGKI